LNPLQNSVRKRSLIICAKGMGDSSAGSSLVTESCPSVIPPKEEKVSDVEKEERKKELERLSKLERLISERQKAQGNLSLLLAEETLKSRGGYRGPPTEAVFDVMFRGGKFSPQHLPENIKNKFEIKVCGQTVIVTLPPTQYKTHCPSAYTPQETFKTKRVFKGVCDSTKAQALFEKDPLDEFKDHLLVEQIESLSLPLFRCNFMGESILVHEGSVTCGFEIDKETKLGFLDEKDVMELQSHIEHKGLYVVLAEKPGNGIYVKMTSRNTGEFQGQTIKVRDLKNATDFLCLECRDSGKKCSSSDRM
jgi:hypothetical protein